MKILLINTYDRGGAANACLRLHTGLQKEGIESSILFKSQQKIIPNSAVIKPLQRQLAASAKIKNKVRRILIELKLVKKRKPKENLFIKNRNKNLELFSYPTSNYDITNHPLYKEADIINLHWVAGLLDYKSFFEKNTKPVVWTLHDMNPFTGGEHYSETIVGIDEKGFPVKREFTIVEKEEINKVLEAKSAIFKNVKNLHIISLCNWMIGEVKKSAAFNKFPITIIPNGINSEIFKSRNKEYSRAVLGLPKYKKVVLFVADSISNHRKGFVFLKKAFEQLKDDNVVLCAIGSKKSNLNSINNVVELGPIYDERLMSIAYSAADVFVIPSLMDNLPNTVLESIMCGTPVIGFPVGGIPDMIQHGENGMLTKDISVSSLVETLSLFLKSTDQFDRDKIRENAVKKYDQKIQAANYIKLFESIIENKQ
ncbi:glycosyltransferase [Lutibacter sp.]